MFLSDNTAAYMRFFKTSPLLIYKNTPLYIMILFFLLFIFKIVSWSNYTCVLWFGHLFFGNFQNKMIILICFFSIFIISVLFSNISFLNKDRLDFFLIFLNLTFWQACLFMVNNLFTLVLVIEILSTVIFLLLVSSAFTANNMSKHTLFSISTSSLHNPLFQALIFFFWISFILSIFLFLFLITFYNIFNSYDWFILENVFIYLIDSSSTFVLLKISTLWLFFLISIFLKAGLAPFYFWKTYFFKNIPVHYLFIYIVSFYFFLILFITYVFEIYLNELFSFFAFVTLLFIFLGLIILLSLLWESPYLNLFFALSSILNTLLVFLLLLGDLHLPLVL